MNKQKVFFRCPIHSLAHCFLKNEKSIPFEEGLYLSSLEFYKEYQKLEELKGKEKEKLELTISKYRIRSSSRSTPYATFAGCALAEINDKETKILLAESNEHTRRIRVDMNYITLMIQELLSRKQIRNQILYFPNNSLYEIGNTYRYAEYSIKNNIRDYNLISIEKTQYLEQLLIKSSKGILIPDLVNFLIAFAKVNQTEAEEYIENLCHSQILIAELEPSITGEEPLETLLLQLKKLSGIENIVIAFEHLNNLIHQSPKGVEYYRNIENCLYEMGLVKDNPKNTLQVDLFLKAKTAQIQENLLNKIIHQTDDLKSLARYRFNSDLEHFKNRFYSKYEETAIPLVIALDADLGIGYAGLTEESAGNDDLIDNLLSSISTTYPNSEFDYIQQFALNKYHDYLKNVKSHIEISEEELKSFSKPIEHYKFANSQYLFGSLMKQNGQLDDEHFQFDLTSFGGPSAANLMGRFTHGDKQLKQYVQEILAEEELENPDAIYAEIVHLPQARTANILLRPILRQYEIPYVGKSGIDAEYQIGVDDLMVQIINNEVVITSNKLKKRIIPRLTTAHNFSYRSLPIYKFLCDLQYQGIAFPNVWDWGNLDTLKHLPRVVYKNIIIKKACWKITEQDIKELPNEKNDYRDYFRTFRAIHQLPQRVVYSEGDNELLIDFEELDCLHLLILFIQKYKNIRLEEFLFTEENCIIRDEQNNPYTNEIIIPITTNLQKINSSNNNNLVPNYTSTKQKFTPYSEWMYFKIYCGNKTAEQILRTTILEFVEQGLQNKLFEHFFFIRYKDDFSHIRIRFYNSDITKQWKLFADFQKALEGDVSIGKISKIVLDTYNRELERYGDNFIETVEKLFCFDSIAILRFISLLDGTDAPKYRLLFALRGIDMLLDDFAYSIEEKHRIAQKIQTVFFKEFGACPQLQKQLNEKYRAYQKDIFSHFDKELDAVNEIQEAVAVFQNRSIQIRGLIQETFTDFDTTLHKELFDKWLPSYIHMFMNRLFIAQQRKYELVMYHFLEKYYDSQIALRNQKEKKNLLS